MFGNLLAAALLVFVVGCAVPKYEVAAPTNPGPGNSFEKVTDCTQKFSRSGHCLFWEWEIMPTSRSSGQLRFKIIRPNLLDGTAVPVQPEVQPNVQLWMPSMGHGSRPTVVEPVDLGSFRVKEIFFVMPGDWEIKFQLTREGQVYDETVVSLTF